MIDNDFVMTNKRFTLGFLDIFQVQSTRSCLNLTGLLSFISNYCHVTEWAHFESYSFQLQFPAVKANWRWKCQTRILSDPDRYWIFKFNDSEDVAYPRHLQFFVINSLKVGNALRQQIALVWKFLEHFFLFENSNLLFLLKLTSIKVICQRIEP